MFSGIIRRFSSLDHAGTPSSGDTEHDHHHHATPPAPTSSDGLQGVFTPTHRPTTPAASFRPPPLDPIVLHGYRDDTPSSARVLSTAVAEEIRIMIPERLRISEQWKLAYSLSQNGASLATLYQKCREYHGKMAGFVLAVRDAEGGIFGAYLSEYPHPAPTYYGNGECFLWRASLLPSLPPLPSDDDSIANLYRSTTLAPIMPPDDRIDRAASPASARSARSASSAVVRFKAFPYSGINEYFIHCESWFLSVGAGDGHYGLWLDDALQRGHSSTSKTFGNEPLSDEGDKFDILGVELWVVGGLDNG